jgi:hypothetical protein
MSSQAAKPIDPEQELIGKALRAFETSDTKVTLKHGYNYMSGGFSRRRQIGRLRDNEEENASTVVYTSPGKARNLSVVTPDDPRAGAFPQHNNPGSFHTNLEILDSLSLDEFFEYSTEEDLIELSWKRKVYPMTQKKFYKAFEQFANLSLGSFKEMLCTGGNDKKRDFPIYVFKDDKDSTFKIASVNPSNDFVQFIQVLKHDKDGKVIDLRHINYDLGTPMVITQSCIDCHGNLRQIAHVGITGAKTNVFKNSLERFDDSTVIWTVSRYDHEKISTGSAALKSDSSVVLIPGGDHELAKQAARNLGAERIDPSTRLWTGAFGEEACVPEMEDKMLIRIEYKAAVRKQSFQIVDGACIPGLRPVFDFNPVI